MSQHAHTQGRLKRRTFLALGGGLALATARPVFAQAMDAGGFGVVPNSTADQTDALQAAIDAAAAEGKPLMLAAGRYQVGRLALRGNLHIEGVPGATVLVGTSNDPVLSGDKIANLSLFGLSLDGNAAGSTDTLSGLARFTACTNLTVDACGFANANGNGIVLLGTSGRVSDCTASGLGLTAIFAKDSAGLTISGNRISACGNGGIRVFRNKAGPDGTIVSGNTITAIHSGSGNGQNGNGINVFRADGVIVANNVVSDVDFSAVRLNSTNDCIVKGNICNACREVAIFSEFAFSGSIIADNVIDGAAAGISMTNFDQGGHLAVCQGNLVRNIYPASPTNPDVRPYGIHAQADIAVTGNVVESVPGIGISAGWGQYLRDVLIANNVVRDTEVAISVSVAPGAGHARIAGNMISDARQRAIAAFAWRDVKGEDLATSPKQFDTVTVEGNTVS